METITESHISKLDTEMLLELVDKHKDRLMVKIRQNELEEKQV
ncbi:MAG: hypothetical protein RR636_14440 [Clostridium sp.]